jgi:hypothetical protein
MSGPRTGRLYRRTRSVTCTQPSARFRHTPPGPSRSRFRAPLALRATLEPPRFSSTGGESTRQALILDFGLYIIMLPDHELHAAIARGNPVARARQNLRPAGRAAVFHICTGPARPRGACLPASIALQTGSTVRRRLASARLARRPRTGKARVCALQPPELPLKAPVVGGRDPHLVLALGWSSPRRKPSRAPGRAMTTAPRPRAVPPPGPVGPGRCGSRTAIVQSRGGRR